MMKRLVLFLAVFVCSSLILPSTSFSAVEYEVVDLGFAGIAWSINDFGQVIGSCNSEGSRAFAWDSVSGGHLLSTLPGCDTLGYSINSHGEMVGRFYSNYPRYCIWDSQGNRQNIDELNPVDSFSPYGINDSGQVVGTRWTGSKFLGSVWSAEAGLVDLDSTEGGSNALAINESEVVVGRTVDTNGQTHACIWEQGQSIRNLDAEGSTYSQASDVNNNNVAVGWANDTNNIPHATIWDPVAGMLNIDIPGTPGTCANAINDNGTIVGDMHGVRCGFIWDSVSGMQELNSLIDPASGWVIGAACDINENGWIVGNAYRSGDWHEYAVLLKPVPEPSSIIALVSGLCGLAAMRRRKS